MLRFYNDGLKDESWIPDTQDEFKEYVKDIRSLSTANTLILFLGNKRFLYIDTVYTMKKHRGRGKATKLLTDLVKGQRSAIICSERMIPFYESIGYSNQLPYTIMIKDERCTNS